jgi:hypothetical protein
MVTEFYREIRREFPTVPIAIGNLLAIYAGEQLLSEFPDAILCVGEGEIPLAELYRSVMAANGVLRAGFAELESGGFPKRFA